VWLLLTALASSRSRPKGRVLVPLLLTGFAALDAVRHIPIFVLLAIPVIAAALPAADPPQRSRKTGAASHLVAVPSAFQCRRDRFDGWGSYRQDGSVLPGTRMLAKRSSFLNKESGSYVRATIPANLFVYYDWGGYAIWKLYPEYRVFVDGRADLYGDELLSQGTEHGAGPP
jgi:hypothetical protein